MPPDNVDLMRGIYEVIESGDVDRADTLLAEDLIEHEDPPPGASTGLEGFKDFVRRMRRGFPDLRCRIEDVTADGDKVWARAVLSGTHDASSWGSSRPATAWSSR